MKVPFTSLKALSTSLLAIAFAAESHAANVLFVTEHIGFRTNTGISTTLTNDGHTVTLVNDSIDFTAISAALNGDLSSYQLLVLDLYDSGSATATEATSVSDFIAAGGSVFVTGYDSIRGATWGTLAQSIVGAGAGSDGGSSATITSSSNNLTTGVVDIRGLNTGLDGDLDTISSLASDTEAVAGGIWSLRTPISGGQVAYLSTTAGFDYSSNSSYEGALRNFAASVPEPSSTLLSAFGLTLFGLRRRRS